MSLEAKRHSVQVGRHTILFIVATLIATPIVYAKDDASGYPQRCEDEWKARPDVKALCDDNHRFAAKRYGYRRVLELAGEEKDLDLGRCAREALKAENSGGVGNWRRVEDCLLSRDEEWSHALSKANGSIAVEAARYVCGLVPAVAIIEFDTCFFQRLKEIDSRLSEPSEDDIKESSWKVYRTCLSTDKDVLYNGEETALALALEPLQSEIENWFTMLPRTRWRGSDEAQECAIRASSSRPRTLYFPILELCYRASTDAQLSGLLRPWPLWSHALSLHVCKQREGIPFDTCLQEQSRSTQPICEIFQSIDKAKKRRKGKMLRAVHVCEALARFDEFGHFNLFARFDGFYDLPSLRYCVAEQTKLMGIPKRLVP